MKALGLNATDEELDDMINEVDLDRTGSVDLDEFVKMMTHSSVTIDAHEISKVMESFGEKLSDEELQIMMEEVDKDDNGSIDYEEFVNFFLSK
ncbi:EF-hand protein [Diplogelasinospora grovesii]|uniref:Calmodulin n=1 Tax=Diplogelasinospora grovesii TaxID=303347 RepID=A0AAN6RYR2_9PEZI|nr:EF-hand protein [Diplogelasinospora grovesii]